jgi:hypothetical protein
MTFATRTIKQAYLSGAIHFDQIQLHQPDILQLEHFSKLKSVVPSILVERHFVNMTFCSWNN